MRRIVRLPVSKATSAALARLTAAVKGAAEPAQKAASLWNRKPKAVFDDVRATLETMAAGRGRCMYCEDSQGTDIEHFYPKARYPGRAFSWKNYLYACAHCNSNLKRDRFPLVHRKPALLDPTADDPARHVAFIPSTGEFLAIGPKGRPSIDVFGLNDVTTPRKLPQARRETFLKLQLLLLEYDRCSNAGDSSGAAFAKQTILDEPFTAVLGWLLGIASGPAGDVLLRPGVPAIIARHGVSTWI